MSRFYTRTVVDSHVSITAPNGSLKPSAWVVVIIDGDQGSESQSNPAYQEVGTHKTCGIISTTILLFFSLFPEL
jgi:hypothetical protein